MSSIHLNNYDFFFGAIILGSILLAIMRGGVSEILSVSKWIVALIICKKYNIELENLISNLIDNQLLRSLISYIIAFIIAAIIITIIKIIFHSMIKSLGLGTLNLLIGGIFGFARGVIICSVIIMLFEIIGIDKTHSWSNSLISPIIKPVVTTLITNFDTIRNLEQNITEATNQAW